VGHEEAFATRAVSPLQVSAARPRIVVRLRLTPRRFTVDSSLRYFGCVVGFGFGVLWMTQGLGAAIVCLLLGGAGYGVVLAAERARANPDAFRLQMPSRTPAVTDDLPSQADDLNTDLGHVYEPSEDASSPLAAEVEYGWPVEQPDFAHTNGR
jgi:hypothetical protein